MCSVPVLPITQRFEFEEPMEGEVLEFRLIYKGALPADTGKGGRTKYKHLIRKCFHGQLRELWQQHVSLRLQAETLWLKQSQNADGTWNVLPVVGPSLASARPLLSAGAFGQFNRPSAMGIGPAGAKSWIEHIADDHTAYGGRWVPLVSKIGGFTCELNILFLRRDAPGGLVAHGGDIDNRIKTLIDGLRKPESVSDLGGLPIDDDENPFHVLLEDDRLITALTVTTDRLLVPCEGEEKQHWVELIVGVKIVNPHALFVGNRLV